MLIMEDEVHSGILNHFKASGLGKKWNKRWAALHKRSSHGIQRIELYDTKESFEKRDKAARKHVMVINLEQCVNFAEDQILEGKKKEYLLKLNFQTDEKQHVFSFDTPEAMNGWMKAISSVVFNSNENLDYNSTFQVFIAENEITEKLNLQGKYFLTVSAEDIELLEFPSKKPVIKWPLHLLRKYGRDKQEFSLEAGRRCPSGPGMFYFKTDQYNAIFQEVENNVKSIASRSRAASTSSTSSLVKGGYPNKLQFTQDTARPASPRMHPSTDVYDFPLDTKKDKKTSNPADDYTYNEPVHLMPPPTAKPMSLPVAGKNNTAPNLNDHGKKKSKGLATLIKQPVSAPKKPNRVFQKPKPSAPAPELVAEATYSNPIEASGNAKLDDSLNAQYSHLNIGGQAIQSTIDTEYDSISYPDQWKAGTAALQDTTYATTGDFSEYADVPPSTDDVYDHVQR